MTISSMLLLRSQSTSRSVQRLLRTRAPLSLRSLSTAAAAVSEESSTSAVDNDRILESALKQVPFYGWTQDAVVAGIQQDFPKGTSLSLAGVFTPRDLVRFHMDHCNARLREELPKHLEEQLENSANNTVEEKIIAAFQLRLGYSKHLLQNNRWHEGMAMGVAGPGQAWTTTEQLKEIVTIVADEVAKMPEQDNTEESSSSAAYQPRVLGELERIGLGGIYVATELHMLTDTSPDYQDTWAFLRQRIHEWSTLSLSDIAATVGRPLVFAGAFGVGNALSVSRTLSAAFAGATVSVLQLPPPPFLANGASGAINGVGDALSVGKTLGTAVASGTASVLQLNPPFLTNTGSTSAMNGVGDALSVGKTLSTAVASGTASVLQLNPPFQTNTNTSASK